jgi:hypothetical protein
MNTHGWHESRNSWTVSRGEVVAWAIPLKNGTVSVRVQGLEPQRTFDEGTRTMTAHNPSQLLDAMIRADRMVAGDDDAIRPLVLPPLAETPA